MKSNIQKSIFLVLTVFLIFPLIMSCDKKNETTTEKKINVLDSEFTVKYEIIFPRPVVLHTGSSSNEIRYWAENLIQGKQEILKEIIPSGTITWTKTYVAKLKMRPYKMGFSTYSDIGVGEPEAATESAKCTIYINGHKVSSMLAPSHRTTSYYNIWFVSPDVYLSASVINF